MPTLNPSTHRIVSYVVVAVLCEWPVGEPSEWRRVTLNEEHWHGQHTDDSQEEHGTQLLLDAQWQSLDDNAADDETARTARYSHHT